jgi:hypothetical protein
MENMTRNGSRGLGDDIKKITSATGLDQLAKRIAQLLDEDCGCDDRQAWLNEQTKDWWPYKKRNIENGDNK